jgi:uncharacterized OsmC-like protein
MARPLIATLTLIEGARFAARTSSSGAVDLAPAVEDSSLSNAVSPIEALLAAPAGCLGMSAAPFVRRIRPLVTGYEIRAR